MSDWKEQTRILLKKRDNAIRLETISKIAHEIQSALGHGDMYALLDWIQEEVKNIKAELESDTLQSGQGG